MANKHCHTWLCAIILLLCHARVDGGPGSRVDSIELQAALIKNFTHLIEWPNNSRVYQNMGKFHICVLNSPLIAKKFAELFSAIKLKKKAVSVQKIASPNDLPRCELVYLDSLSTEAVSLWVIEAQKLGVLAVGFQRGLAEQGVHINFYLDRNRMAFEINRDSFKETKLDISFQLIKYAKIVSPSKAREGK